MKKTKVKSLAIVSVLFLIDLVKPFGLSLFTEFLLIGIIFSAFKQELLVSIIIGVVFGYLKDSFGLGQRALSIVEFPLICLITHYLLAYFIFVSKKKYVMIAKGTVILIVTVFHIVFSSFCTGLFLPSFSLMFIVQSFLLFFLIDYLLEDMIPTHPSKLVK